MRETKTVRLAKAIETDQNFLNERGNSLAGYIAFYDKLRLERGVEPYPDELIESWYQADFNYHKELVEKLKKLGGRAHG